VPSHDEPQREPWDARLIGWMSRGSNTARGGRMTPEAACFVAVSYVILPVLYRNPGWYVLAALAVANALRVVLRTRSPR
jgi:hypothetical protein